MGQFKEGNPTWKSVWDFMQDHMTTYMKMINIHMFLENKKQ